MAMCFGTAYEFLVKHLQDDISMIKANYSNLEIFANNIKQHEVLFQNQRFQFNIINLLYKLYIVNKKCAEFDLSLQNLHSIILENFQLNLHSILLKEEIQAIVFEVVWQIFEKLVKNYPEEKKEKYVVKESDQFINNILSLLLKFERVFNGTSDLRFALSDFQKLIKENKVRLDLLLANCDTILDLFSEQLDKESLPFVKKTVPVEISKEPAVQTTPEEKSWRSKSDQPLPNNSNWKIKPTEAKCGILSASGTKFITDYCMEHLVNGKCSRGSKCHFNHIKGDRKKYCWDWARNAVCSRGENCEFVHVSHE